MYSTHIGKSVREFESREDAYRAALTANQAGWKYVNILSGDDLECRVILKEDGGVFIWTPNVEDKWEINKFFRDVNRLNDVIFRAA